MHNPESSRAPRTMSRRGFVSAAGAAAAGLALAARPSLAFADHHEGGDIVGHGDFRYRVVKDWGNLDAATYPIKDCHAMVQDSRGRIILLNNDTTFNFIAYDKSGKLLEAWGHDFPGAHGMVLVTEGGEDFVWITDHDRHQVFKMTLDGREVLTLDYPRGSGVYDNAFAYKPTWVAVAPNGDVYVHDGYGLAYIIQYDAKGELIRTFGGRGDGPENLNTPHGGVVDARDPNNPFLIVASRGQEALKRFTLNGEYIDTTPMPGARVCSVWLHGDQTYVPHLNGFCSVLDRNLKVLSNPGGSAPVYDANTGLLQPMEPDGVTFIHPHGIMVDDEGDIYVPQWNSEKTYPVKLVRV